MLKLLDLISFNLIISINCRKWGGVKKILKDDIILLKETSSTMQNTSLKIQKDNNKLPSDP
jgi:hypothetical protein